MNEVIERIKAGGTTPISSTELSKTYGISGQGIRQIINAARICGYPICSCQKGYYYSELPQDIQRTVSSLQHRITSMQGAIDGLRGCLEGSLDEI